MPQQKPWQMCFTKLESYVSVIPGQVLNMLNPFSLSPVIYSTNETKDLTYSILIVRRFTELQKVAQIMTYYFHDIPDLIFVAR